MNTRTIITRSAVAATVAILLGSSPASAYHLGAPSAECRAAVAKAYGKLLKTANKTIAGCHKARNKDVALVGTDCNDMTAADADKGKYASSVTKFVTTVSDACTGEATSVLTAANEGGEVGETELYISCPVDPCAGVTGVIDTAGEIGACLGCVAADIAEQAGVATLGLPNPADLDKDEQKCHGAIAKGYSKYLATAHKTETACQGDVDETGEADISSCINNDPKLKVSGSLTKAGEGLDKSCATPVNLVDVDGCATDTVANLKTCSGAAWTTAKDDAFTTTYLLPALGCPSSVRTTILGGCSTEDQGNGDCVTGVGFATGTVLSVGWKGLAHGVDITDNYTVAVDVTCAGTEKGSCGTCTSTGISYDNPQAQSFTRCVDDPSRECDEPFAADLDCGVCAGGVNAGDNCTADGDCPGSTCTAQQCKYFLGPPLAVSAGGTPTCTLNVVNTDIVGGTGDPDLGTADFTVDLRSVVHLGISQSRPCPYCRNDAVPLDGVRGGTCFDGPKDGQACDVQGYDLTFANPTLSDAPTSGNSLDCPPTSGANISGSGLAINLPLTTGTSSKDAEDPCESPLDEVDCFCGVCSGGGGGVSCNNDTDCALLGFGTCGIGSGVDRKQNNCTDGFCWPAVPTPRTDRGQCRGVSPVCYEGTSHGLACVTDLDCPGGSCVTSGADVDSFCSGMLFANGKGLIACGVDADCDTYVSGSVDPDDWVCPNDDCGTCTEASFRSCFLDPMEISGTPDPENPILAGTFCLPPSSNGSVNNTTGSPGPGAVQTDAIVELRY